MRIKEARKAKGLTLKELGDRIGASESAVSLYERGRREPSFQTLLMLAEELDTTVGYLLGEEQKAAPALTGTEKQLLYIFKQLDNEGQRLAIGMMKTLLTEHSQKNHTAIVNEVTG